MKRRLTTAGYGLQMLGVSLCCTGELNISSILFKIFPVATGQVFVREKDRKTKPFTLSEEKFDEAQVCYAACCIAPATLAAAVPPAVSRKHRSASALLARGPKRKTRMNCKHRRCTLEHRSNRHAQNATKYEVILRVTLNNEEARTACIKGASRQHPSARAETDISAQLLLRPKRSWVPTRSSPVAN